MHEGLWHSVLGEIEVSISSANFQTWFAKTEIVSREGSVLSIGVANIFAKKQFEAKFDPLIKKILENNGVEKPSLNYVVKTSGKRTAITRETTRNTHQITANDLIGQSQNKYDTRTVSSQQLNNTLNPRYTFDTFIVGSSNDLAYTACKSVSENPGTKYNPLYLYGGVGLGKTHLMQAVGNEILKSQPNLRVLYISCETFVQDFMDTIRFKKNKNFSDKYRSVDVLIIDDMQFIANKEKTQEEFFHTFNALHQNNKQIIISSDKPPKSIPTLTERLRSRFEWGMAIDIQMPDFETRCAIVETKAALSGIELTRDTIEYLANNIKTNVRELEGALNQLLAYAEMRGVAPDISTAEGLLGNVRSSRPQHVTPKQIIDKTAKHFQIETKEICGAKRDKHIVMPRQVAMYLLRSELHLSFPRIAQALGRKDHTTAMHSIEKIEKSIKLDFIVRQQVSEIRDKLYA